MINPRRRRNQQKNTTKGKKNESESDNDGQDKDPRSSANTTANKSATVSTATTTKIAVFAEKLTKPKNDEIGADALLDLWDSKPEKTSQGKGKKQKTKESFNQSTVEFSEESVESLSAILEKTQISCAKLNLSHIPLLFRDPHSWGEAAGNCAAEVIGTAGAIEGISAMARALEINPFLFGDRKKTVANSRQDCSCRCNCRCFGY
mmetsp:Transcript_3537/g.4756  ORF Transcript_3537/g.4756 Transcript_3537/m.4756 type:complete len:205 (+) Transcript_3537:2-616(+)